MLWRLDPVLQRGHDLPDIASEEGWGIEPEPRKDCGLEQPTCVRLHFLIRVVLQDKPAHHALAQDDHHIFQHASRLIVPTFCVQVDGCTAGGDFHNQLRRAGRIPILRDA